MSDPSTKDLMHRVADRLPPNATLEEAMERLIVLAKIERGIADAEAGRTLSHEEVAARLGL